MKTWTEQEWRSSVDQTLLEKYPDACAQAYEQGFSPAVAEYELSRYGRVRTPGTLPELSKPTSGKEKPAVYRVGPPGLVSPVAGLNKFLRSLTPDEIEDFLDRLTRRRRNPNG